MTKLTPFQEALIAATNGKLKVPTVMMGEDEIYYFGYQMAVHRYNLGIMAMGMKCRGITFTQIKKYYGLKGRSAKECLPQLEQMLIDYRNATIK